MTHKDILKNDNLVFYGKKISEMTENELNLLRNDIIMCCSMECEELGVLIIHNFDDEEIVLGDVQTTVKFSSERVKILSEIMNMKDSPNFIIILFSEQSEYSFDKFCCDLFVQLETGLITPNNVESKFPHPFSMN